MAGSWDTGRFGVCVSKWLMQLGRTLNSSRSCDHEASWRWSWLPKCLPSNVVLQKHLSFHDSLSVGLGTTPSKLFLCEVRLSMKAGPGEWRDQTSFIVSSPVTSGSGTAPRVWEFTPSASDPSLSYATIKAFWVSEPMSLQASLSQEELWPMAVVSGK